MSPRAIPAPLWFVAALIPMVLSQILRLKQFDPATWIAWDYAGRLGGLANGKTYPSLSKVAFAITGSRWNGPRFFGLRDKPASEVRP
jgi:CAAX protease family protein